MPVTCFSCGIIGHYAPQCPQKHKIKEEKSTQTGIVCIIDIKHMTDAGTQTPQSTNAIEPTRPARSLADLAAELDEEEDLYDQALTNWYKQEENLKPCVR
jgi:hypothetical protein